MVTTVLDKMDQTILHYNRRDKSIASERILQEAKRFEDTLRFLDERLSNESNGP
jgi:hypothetical protein